MPLTDLVRYFNAADHAGEGTLYLDGGEARAWYAGLGLASLFEPVVDLPRERILGHRAALSARGDDGMPIGPESIYAACPTPAAIVQFDRLCRTLHALNFLAQRRHAGGYLQLAVHPRHLMAVPSQHGLVYEAILKRCGLAPEDIVLEIEVPAGGLSAGLRQAIDNYRLRGYRLALAWPDSPEGDPAALELQPDIIRLPHDADRALLAAARERGILIERDGIASGLALAAARSAGIDLGRGSLFGAAQTLCRPTHRPPGQPATPPATGASE
ncbi:MAG: EAL domain-containing protein [Dechloromonas sp.]|nr:EAL domain-containing protein [Dechloromonas sp.]